MLKVSIPLILGVPPMGSLKIFQMKGSKFNIVHVYRIKCDIQIYTGEKISSYHKF